MAHELDEKILIELLAEIVEKSDGETLVELDLTDPVRESHMNWLKNDKEKKYIKYFTRYVGSNDPNRISTHRETIGILDLTRDGYLLLSDLRIKHAELEWKREQNERDRERFRFDKLALLLSVVALLLSAFR